MVGWRLLRRVVLLGVAAILGGTLAVGYPCLETVGLFLFFAFFLYVGGLDTPYYFADARDDDEMTGPGAWACARVLPYYLSFTVSFGTLALILWLTGAREPSCA